MAPHNAILGSSDHRQKLGFVSTYRRIASRFATAKYAEAARHATQPRTATLHATAKYMTKWEYKTIQVPFSKGWGTPQLDRDGVDTILNHLGQDGWEVVSALTTNQENGRSGEVIILLKRSFAA